MTPIQSAPDRRVPIGGARLLAALMFAMLCLGLLAVPPSAMAQTSTLPQDLPQGGPQSIEDLLDGIAEEDAPAAWQEPGLPVRATPTLDRPVALLRALNKMTTRIDTLALPVGEARVFGTLTVTVRACRVTEAGSQGEQAAFLEVDDAPPWGEAGRVFSGWMLADARAVNTMEHAVYDLWLEGCVNEAPRPAEDFGLTARYTLPDRPPPPLPVPAFRR